MMQIITDLTQGCAHTSGAVVALGNFDGVHRGHQAILQTAAQIAETHNTRWGVLTFDPHPVRFLRPKTAPNLLTTPTQKAAFIAQQGANMCITLSFDQTLASMSADQFITQILVAQLQLSHVVIGHDFIFGHQRQGNAQLLKRYAQEGAFEVTQLSAVGNQDCIYSSTAIRQALAEGDVVQARHMLGRPFTIEGAVEKGKQLGRTLGFKTANIALGEYLRPRYGVYAVRVWHQERCFEGVANIGMRPSVDGTEEWLEVHLFEVDEELYQQVLSVELWDFIRPEQTFENVQLLTKQIGRDCQMAKEALNSTV